MSPSTTEDAALNMLGHDLAHEEVPYFFSVLGDWVNSSTSAGIRVGRGDRTRLDPRRLSRTGTCRRGSQGCAQLRALRDLDHARRLLVAGTSLNEAQRGALRDTESDLAGVAP